MIIVRTTNGLLKTTTPLSYINFMIEKEYSVISLKDVIIFGDVKTHKEVFVRKEHIIFYYEENE